MYLYTSIYISIYLGSDLNAQFHGKYPRVFPFKTNLPPPKDHFIKLLRGCPGTPGDPKGPPPLPSFLSSPAAGWLPPAAPARAVCATLRPFGPRHRVRPGPRSD